MTAPRGIDWQEVPLGRYPDSELARRLMTTRQAVCFQRNARRIAPFDSLSDHSLVALSHVERRDLYALDEAVSAVVRDGARLTFKLSSLVCLVAGWRAQSRHARQSGGDGKDSARPLASAFRFQKPGTRQWSSWMNPQAARVWLLQNGWADEAKRRIDALRARADREGAGATHGRGFGGAIAPPKPRQRIETGTTNERHSTALPQQVRTK